MALASVLEIPKERIHNTEHGRVRERDGGRFQIQFTDANGRRHTKTFSTMRKAEGELKSQAALKDKGIIAEAENTSRAKVSALAESYKLYAQNSAPKSYDWIELVWRVHLEPVFGHLNAGRVTVDEIEAYRAARREALAATSTINREVTVLKALFNHALRNGKISAVPRFPQNLAEPNPRSGFLTAEEYGKLQKACKHDWLRALLAVAYNFGFRKSELLGLNVSQVDLKAQTIRLLPGETKSGLGRTVVMTAEVLPLITECMIRAGVSRDVARKITGHATDSIFSRYNITDENDLADAARKLEIAAKLQRQEPNVEK